MTLDGNMAIEIIAVVTGVLFHFAWTLGRTENPANIPFHLFFRRHLLTAATIQLLVWTTVSAGVYVVSLLLLDGEDRPGVRAVLALNSGLLVPALPRMERLLKTQPIASGFSLPRLLSSSPGLSFDLLLRNAIDRAEGQVAWEVLQDQVSRKAINKLYEFHLPDLLVTRGGGPGGGFQVAEQLSRVTHPRIKLSLLLRLLGYKPFMKALDSLKSDPNAILPAWDGQERRLLKDAQFLEAYAEGKRRLDQRPIYARRSDEADLQADRLLEGSGLKALALRELEASALAPWLTPEPRREEG